jgi:hypothetical protein
MPVFVSAARGARICARWPEKALIQHTPTLIDRDRTAHNLLIAMSSWETGAGRGNRTLVFSLEAEFGWHHCTSLPYPLLHDFNYLAAFSPHAKSPKITPDQGKMRP